MKQSMLIIALVVSLLFTACSSQTGQEQSGADNKEKTKVEEESTTVASTSKTEEESTSQKSEEQKTMNIENLEKGTYAKLVLENGEVLIKLMPEVAPKTVENFVKLAKDKFYDGLIFHRVIEGFMIQGGDPTGTGMGGSDQNVVGEFAENGIENPLSHKRGVISMARSQSPNSASSQFFIVHQDAFFLDGKYAAFGEVVSGMEFVDQIAETATDGQDRPKTEQKIRTIEIIEVE